MTVAARHKDGKIGGYLVGNRHSQGGIKAVNKDSGAPLEVESDEVIITRKAVLSDKTHEFNGRQMTNLQILSEINEQGGGVKLMEQGGLTSDSYACKCSGKTCNYQGRDMSDRAVVKKMARDGMMLSKGGMLPITDAVYSFDDIEDYHSEFAAYLDFIGAKSIKDRYQSQPLDPGVEAKLRPDQYQRALGWLLKRFADPTFQIYTAGQLIYSATDPGTMEKGGHVCGCQHAHKFPPHLYPGHHYEQGGQLSEDALSDTERKILERFGDNPNGFICLYGHEQKDIAQLVSQGIVYSTGRTSSGCMDVFLTDRGRKWVRPLQYKEGGEIKKPGRTQIGEPAEQTGAFRGVDHVYANAFEVNRAIEALLDGRESNTGFSSDEQRFLKYYSGYGGLEKFGASGPGLLYEYFTPTEIAKRMWGLAYKWGYKGTGAVLEPSCGIGEFFNYAPEGAPKDGLEINPYSARICRILHPGVNVQLQSFEELFIKGRDTVRGKVSPKYELVIGNPPYGNFQGKFAGMGEKSYTHASNYVDYFMTRSLDIVHPGGLVIFIIGVEVSAGGVPFLAQRGTVTKQDIADKANLLDAYRLPNGVFERTDVLTDIIVLQKK